MSFNAFGFPPSSSGGSNMTSMTGNTVLLWWATDVPLVVVGIPHQEFITKYCPNARPEGIARLDGHRLAISRRRDRDGDLVITKVKKRGRASSTRTTKQPAENTTKHWSQMLEAPSLPHHPDRITNTIGSSSTRRRSNSQQQSLSMSVSVSAHQASYVWPESNVSPPTPNAIPDDHFPSPSSDMNDSIISFVSDETTVVAASRHQLNNNHQHEHNNRVGQRDTDDSHNNHREEEVWGIVYLLTSSQYDRFLRGHHQSQSQPNQPHQNQVPQLGHLQLRPLPRPFGGIPLLFSSRNQNQDQNQDPTSASASASTSSVQRQPSSHPKKETKKKHNKNLPEVQVHFFQHDLLRQSAARQHVFPSTAGDAVHRHPSQVKDLRRVRVLLPCSLHGSGSGSDDANVDTKETEEAVVEAMGDTMPGGDFGYGCGGYRGEGREGGREGGEGETEEGRKAMRNEMMYRREQRNKEKREEMVQSLKKWAKDLEKRGVPKEWVRVVVLEGLVGRIQNQNDEGDYDSQDGEEEEEEEEEVLEAEDSDDDETDEEWGVEGHIMEAMVVIARNMRGASRIVLDFARRGVEAMVAQLRGEDEGGSDEGEEWEMVEFSDQRVPERDR